MRCTLILAALLCFAVAPAWATDSGPTYAEIKTLPCKTFASVSGTQLFSYVLDPIASYLDSRGKEGAIFGSLCNIGDYVEVTCKAHPSFTVENAVNDLLSKSKRGQTLPTIPRCGA